MVGASTTARVIDGFGKQTRGNSICFTRRHEEGMMLIAFHLTRFSCCSKVFPCDKLVDKCFKTDHSAKKNKISFPPGYEFPLIPNGLSRCHDSDSDHPNEHANRMIW